MIYNQANIFQVDITLSHHIIPWLKVYAINKYDEQKLIIKELTLLLVHGVSRYIYVASLWF